MPNYEYVCSRCGEQFTVTRSMHDDGPVKHCGLSAGRIYEMPRIGAGALETKGRSARLEAQREKHLSDDRDAYKRMRRNGIQPRQINGSAVLETQANDQFEVDYGRLFPTKMEKAKVREGIERSVELGLETA